MTILVDEALELTNLTKTIHENAQKANDRVSYQIFSHQDSLHE